MCVLKNKRFRAYRAQLLFCPLGHAQGWDLGAGGQKLERGDLRWRPIDCVSTGRLAIKYGFFMYVIVYGSNQRAQ